MSKREPKRKAYEPKKRTYVVTYTVELRGSTLVEATSAEAAREEWLSTPEFDTARSEMTDWTCLGVKEES